MLEGVEVGELLVVVALPVVEVRLLVLEELWEDEVVVVTEVDVVVETEEVDEDEEEEELVVPWKTNWML